MLNVFFWLTFGILSGWTVALIIHPDDVTRRTNTNGLVGIVGGMFGGGIAHYVSHQSVVGGFDGLSIVTAVIVALVFVSLYNFIIYKLDM